MARNGSGVYSLPSGNLAVSGQTISSTKANALWQDLEADMNVDRPIVAGGTGASTAADARTNLGLAIGSDVQAYDAGLASISGLTTAADRMIYTTASDTYAVTPLTAFARSILDDADAASVRATIGAGVGGGDLVASNNLSDLANATTARTNLGVAIGSNVQAYDAGLADIAGLAVTDGNFIVANGTNWIVESGATARTSLGLGSLATLSSVNNGNWSGTDLAVANGGTGASDAATARTNLGAYGSGDNVSFGTLEATGTLYADPNGVGSQGYTSVAQIQANGSGNSGILIHSGTTSSGYITFGDGAVAGRLQYDHSSNSLIISTNASEAMRLDSSGNVGIGTTSPSTKLHVAGGGYFTSNLGVGVASPTAALEVNGQARVNNGIASVPSFGFRNDTGTGMFLATTGELGFSTAGSERLRIDNSGNLGIGTSAPAYILDIDGPNSSEAIRITAPNNTFLRMVSGTTGDNRILFGDSADDDTGGIYYFHSSDAMAFRTNGNTERMRIDSSGNVGIGTTSPGAKLDVNGEMRAYAENNASVNGTLVNATHLKGAISGLNGNVTVPTATAGANGVLCGDGSARTITRGSGLTMYVNGSNVASATLAARGVASVLFTTASVCYVSGDVS